MLSIYFTNEFLIWYIPSVIFGGARPPPQCVHNHPPCPPCSAAPVYDYVIHIALIATLHVSLITSFQPPLVVLYVHYIALHACMVLPHNSKNAVMKMKFDA